MTTNKIIVIMHFIFTAIFVLCITGGAVQFNDKSLLWWYMLPSILSFCCLVSCCSTKEG